MVSPPYRIPLHGAELTGRQARRLSRSFAQVGVEIPAPRLREIAAGASASASEATNVHFALLATETRREDRQAKRRRVKDRNLRWLVAVTLFFVLLNTLVCVGYVFFSLAEHGWML